MKKRKKYNKHKVTLFSNKIYSFYFGLSHDLLFFVAISSIFFTNVKALTFSEILSLTTFSSLAYLVLQIPILFMINKFGNTHCMRIGNFFLVISSVLFIFGNSFIMLLIGYIIYITAFQFKVVDPIILRSNLVKENKEKSFRYYNSQGKFIYSLASATIFLTAGALYDLYSYLPLILGLILSVGIFIISLFIKDYTEVEERKLKQIVKEIDEVIEITNNSKNKDEKNFSKKLKQIFKSRNLTTLVIFLFIACALFMGINSGGFSSSPMMLQQENMAATAITICIAVAWLARMLSNMFYIKLANFFKDSFLLVLCFVLIAGLFVMYLSSLFIPIFILRVIGISIGISLIYFVRDPFQLYVQDIIFDNFTKKQRSTLISLTQMMFKVGSLILTPLTAIVIDTDVSLSIILMIPFTLIAGIVSVFLILSVRKLSRKKEERKLEKKLAKLAQENKQKIETVGTD